MSRSATGSATRSASRSASRSATRSATRIGSARSASKSLSQTESVVFESQDRSAAIIMVLGLGCHEMDDGDKELYADQFKKGSVATVAIECNKSVVNSVKDVLKTACSLAPSRKEKQVQHVIKLLNNLLWPDRNGGQQNRHVYILGHSYGGSVVSRVAQIISDDSARIYRFAKRRIHAATFGSIYIPSPVTTAGVDIVHYMFQNDVATKCNKQAMPERVAGFDERSGIVWLPSPFNNLLKRFDIKGLVFGTKSQWVLHNMYHGVINKLLKERIQNGLPLLV